MDQLPALFDFFQICTSYGFKTAGHMSSWSQRPYVRASKIPTLFFVKMRTVCRCAIFNSQPITETEKKLQGSIIVALKYILYFEITGRSVLHLSLRV